MMITNGKIKTFMERESKQIRNFNAILKNQKLNDKYISIFELFINKPVYFYITNT